MDLRSVRLGGHLSGLQHLGGQFRLARRDEFFGDLVGERFSDFWRQVFQDGEGLVCGFPVPALREEEIDEFHADDAAARGGVQDFLERDFRGDRVALDEARKPGEVEFRLVDALLGGDTEHEDVLLPCAATQTTQATG